jgi:hypothetical protein
MDANLVGSTGFQGGFYEAHAVGRAQVFVVSHSRFSIDGLVPCSGVAGVASKNGQISTLDRMFSKGCADGTIHLRSDG